MTKILNHINTYADLTAYNNDKDKNYPNIAYIIETNEVKWVKENPYIVVCKYNVTSTSSATKILNSSTGITYQIIDDVKQDTVKATYTFDTLGEHTVKYKFDGTSIADSAFSGCSGLTSVNIPNSVTKIGNRVFSGCSGLTSIKVESGNSVYDSRENCNAIIETATNTLISGCKKTIIPNSVTSIGDSAFSGCSGLTSITIPNSVTSIGDNAFSYCSGLTSVNIPNSVTKIGHSAFNDCSGLTSITIPNSVTKIGVGAFSDCRGLTSVTIGNSVSSIDRFAFDSCSSLTSITIKATTPPTLATSNVFNNTNNCPIYVPAESVDAYKTATNWSALADRIQPIPTE